MFNITVTPAAGFLLTLCIVALLPLAGAIFAFFAFTKIKAAEKLFALFSSYLMIVLSLYLLAIQILQTKITQFHLWQVFPGFLLGFIVVSIVMSLHTFLRKSSPTHKHGHKGVSLSLILLFILAIHEIVEGFSVAEIFSEFGASYVPLLGSLFSVSILAIHEFPEGVLLVLPFFLIRKIRLGMVAVALNQVVFVYAGLAFYFIFLRKSVFSIYQQTFWATLPSGALFFLGLHELKNSFAIKRVNTSPFAKVAFGLGSIVVFIATIASLYFIDTHIEKKTEVRISDFVLDPITGEKRPVIFADPCEYEFDLHECLGD